MQLPGTMLRGLADTAFVVRLGWLAQEVLESTVSFHLRTAWPFARWKPP
jgi:hypothetical protein